MKWIFKMSVILYLLFVFHRVLEPTYTIDLNHLISFYANEYTGIQNNQSLLVHQIHNESEILEVSKKKIYIYNTHQKEQYQSGSVMDASVYLKELLENKGYEVYFETSDFDLYKKTHNMDLTETYPTSRIFLEKNVISNGPFDLIIDLHRDALNREDCFYLDDHKAYAKMMMVIGGDSSFRDTVIYNSSILHETIDELCGGVMRSDFIRNSAVYNQDYTDKMMLIEVGGQYSTFQEVKNSVELLCQAIDICLKEDKFV